MDGKSAAPTEALEAGTACVSELACSETRHGGGPSIFSLFSQLLRPSPQPQPPANTASERKKQRTTAPDAFISSSKPRRAKSFNVGAGAAKADRKLGPARAGAIASGAAQRSLTEYFSIQPARRPPAPRSPGDDNGDRITLPDESTSFSPPPEGVLNSLFSPVFSYLGLADNDLDSVESARPRPGALADFEASAVVECDEEMGDVFSVHSPVAAHANLEPPPPAPSCPPPCALDVEVGPSPAPAPSAEAEGDELDPYLFIARLQAGHVSSPPQPLCLPKKSLAAPPVTLVLDLDETLVHATTEKEGRYDVAFPVHFNGVDYDVFVRKRPHLDLFMERCSRAFEVVVFTASQRVYADKLLNILDPHRNLVRHRVFRDSCVLVEGNYVKDLACLGRDLARTVIVDNSPQAFALQPDNGVPIESWFEDPADAELLRLLPLLDALASAPDVRPLLRRHFALSERAAAAAAAAACPRGPPPPAAPAPANAASLARAST
eukprot:tig00000037_g10099.t1